MNPISIPSPAAAPAASAVPHAAVLRASHVLTGSGPLFVLAAVFAPAALTMFYDLVSSGGTVTVMDAAARLGAALFGALTFGWGVTLRALGQGQSPAHAVQRGAIAWFVVDSTASIALGYGWNTLSNAGFLLVILLLLRGRDR